MEDLYYISTSKAEGLYKEKASKFYGYLFPIYSEQDVENALLELKKIHPKSRHACYAYRLSPSEQIYRANDDGEPSGTAGKPIYNQILSAELYNTLVVVVRYFGGTKLGASGLIRAYKTAAEEVCQATIRKEKYDEISCIITFDYGKMGDLLHTIKGLGIDIKQQVFEANPYIQVALRKSKYSIQIDEIKAKLLSRDIADIEDDTVIDGIQFTVKNT